MKTNDAGDCVVDADRDLTRHALAPVAGRDGPWSRRNQLQVGANGVDLVDMVLDARLKVLVADLRGLWVADGPGRGAKGTVVGV